MNTVKPLEDIIVSPSELALYANGFILGLSASDVKISFQTDKKVSTKVIMSYITLKALQEEINQALQDYEKTTGTSIPVLSEINEKMDKAWNKKK